MVEAPDENEKEADENEKERDENVRETNENDEVPEEIAHLLTECERQPLIAEGFQRVGLQSGPSGLAARVTGDRAGGLRRHRRELGE